MFTKVCYSFRVITEIVVMLRRLWFILWFLFFIFLKKKGRCIDKTSVSVHVVLPLRHQAAVCLVVMSTRALSEDAEQ